jgi:glucosamine--fructose-6-phosphate aminotransferase (isomerizing)
MCGIVGVIGEHTAATATLDALRRLEYRGYDSAGIATLDGAKLWVRKGVGKIEEVEQTEHLSSLPGSLAIGHTRWATHGGVNATNAHPHVNERGTVAVVHNGVIENYQELRHSLESRGHYFRSETDTEVICHLLEERMDTDGMPLENAVQEAVKSLQGSYALLAVSTSDPNKIVAAKKDCPMVLGVGNGTYFASSDPLSFLNRTNEVIYMEDGEVSVLKPNGVFFMNGGTELVTKEATKITWQSDDASRGQYEYFMLKEIMEQPETLRKATKQDKELFNELALDILRADQVIITACGSSRYAALVGRYLFSRIGGEFCDVVMAPEFHYFSDSVDKNTLVIAVSQSGETADVVEGVKRAREKGAKIFSIVNRDPTILSRLSNDVIKINAGPEIGVAATKSFSSQLAIFYLLAFALDNKFDYGVEKLLTMSQEVEKVLVCNNGNLERLASELKNRNDFYYIARGINYAIALEGALKLKEISYIHAEGLPAGELKHGTLALIEQGTPVVVIAPKDYTYDETLTNAMEAKSRGAYIIGVSDEANEIFDFRIQIPKVDELFYPLVAVVPLQLLAYHLARSRGKNPDRPRNLAKSVTVK